MRSFPILGLLVFVAWVAGEIITFNLVSGWTGGGLAFFLLIMKSVLGFVFVQRVIRQKLFGLLRQGGVVLDGSLAGDAVLKGIGGFLLVAPGFMSGIAGLALLTPSIRRRIAGRARRNRQDTRAFDLEQADWKEVSPEPLKRIRRRKKPEETEQG